MMERQPLRVNNRRSIKQHFNYTPDFSPKGKAESSIVSWANRGRGVQGESVNSQSTNDKFIINKNWKPV
jgi:hypothetical protein